MKHITHILACIFLFQLCPKVLADEPDLKDYGLVLMVDHQDPGRKSNFIRVTIENRSKSPIKVIPPPDIKSPWGPVGWWYCGSYKFYLHSGTQGRVEYVCDTPQPPAIPPMLAPPAIVTLLPGQSIGALIYLPLPMPEDATRVGGPNEPPSLISSLNWRKTVDESVGKPPTSGYSLIVEYRPEGYQSEVILQPIGSQKNNEDNATPELVPSNGKRITSNALLFSVEKPASQNK